MMSSVAIVATEETSFAAIEEISSVEESTPVLQNVQNQIMYCRTKCMQYQFMYYRVDFRIA